MYVCKNNLIILNKISISDNKELSLFRFKLHYLLISRLKKAYGNTKWKYTFIKNVENKYGIAVQYQQLNIFEEGGSRNENILNLILLELLSLEDNFDLVFEMEGTNTKIEIQTNKKGA